MNGPDRRCAVLGDPISHSLSPLLHRSAYAALGLDGWRYDRVRMDADGLADFIHGLDPSWSGLSLTMPLKSAVGPLGDFSDYWSRTLGVANTAVFEQGGPAKGLSLYNTDVEGIVAALLEAADRCRADEKPDDLAALLEAAGQGRQDKLPDQPYGGARALVIGNGNTAESAFCALKVLGVERVDLLARNPKHCDHMLDLASRLDLPEPTVTAMDQVEGAEKALIGADIVVSTLPSGAADPLADLLNTADDDGRMGPVLLDVVYDPRPTPLMKAFCRRPGARAISGERMLLYQAVRQVALMTDRPLAAVPVAAMDQALREA
ncbi:shikimate dehydrogenase [Bifidobacterium sp. W8113]|uniref:shikimate dehydrogenase family protein n=1 Tax=Bifidobacterium choladohabitans TaxID=2750947 RepID=UPI0018DC287B|nr:shikimate dehydrogenase [Bifidobacterium choladohabitans]MBI0090389.1 shikimate dehydrogenase [Bifidobacterium choladohabitans]